jgi:hypothetical protein
MTQCAECGLLLHEAEYQELLGEEGGGAIVQIEEAARA